MKQLELLQKLLEEYDNCSNTDCGLYKNSPPGHKIWGRGRIDHPPIMLIGEPPKQEEHEHGTLYAGKPGKLILDYLDKIGESDKTVYSTNVTLCRAISEDKSIATKGQAKIRYTDPTNRQLQACLPRLLQEIYIVDPLVIVLMGDIPIRLFTKKNPAQVMDKMLLINVKGKDRILQYPAMCTYGKARLYKSMSNQLRDERACALEDLVKAKKLATMFAEQLHTVA